MPDILKLRANLWKLKGIRMLFWMHFFAAVLVPFYTDGAAHLTLAHVLFLNSWFMFWNFALEVPTGTIADFFGRKWSLALGALVGVLASLIYASSPDFLTFLVGEVLFAIAYTLNSGADEALAYDTLKVLRSEDEAQGLFASMESFKLGGIIIGTLGGGFIAAKYGLTAPLLAYSIPAALAMLLSLTLYEPPVAWEDEKPLKKLGYVELLKQGVSYFKGHPVLMRLTLEISITNALAWSLVWLFQPLLARAGVDIRMFGVVHALACAGQIILLNKISLLEGWLGSKRLVLLFCSVVTGLAFMDLAFLDSKFLVALVIVLGFTFSLPRVILFNTYMNKYIPSDKRATVLSVSSMFRTLAIVISNLIVGQLADWNLAHTMMILGVLIIALGLLSRIEDEHLA